MHTSAQISRILCLMICPTTLSSRAAHAYVFQLLTIHTYIIHTRYCRMVALDSLDEYLFSASRACCSPLAIFIQIQVRLLPLLLLLRVSLFCFAICVALGSEHKIDKFIIVLSFEKLSSSCSENIYIVSWQIPSFFLFPFPENQEILLCVSDILCGENTKYQCSSEERPLHYRYTKAVF